MLSIENLNNDDLHIIKGIPRSFKASLILGSVIYIPLSFLIGLIGLTKKGIGYWQTSMLFLALFIILFLLTMLKDYIAYKKDVKNKLKLVGQITVTEKSIEKNKILIYTDENELKSFSLPSNESSTQIEIGDTLTIQVSKYSRTLLQLEKKGVDLLNCN